MTPGEWIALLGVGVAVLSLAIPIIVMLSVRRADRERAAFERQAARDQVVIDRLTDTVDRQRETIFNQRIALGQLTHIAESVDRTLGALPLPQDGSGT